MLKVARNGLYRLSAVIIHSFPARRKGHDFELLDYAGANLSALLLIDNVMVMSVLALLARLVHIADQNPRKKERVIPTPPPHKPTEAHKTTLCFLTKKSSVIFVAPGTLCLLASGVH